MVWIGIVPLAPTFAERLSLSPVETGALLASASFATVVVAFPAGLLADRLGARAFTIGSAVVFTLSTVGQGLAGDFWTLLVARAAFGIAFGVAWTAGLAWLADSAPPQPRARALGATGAISGLRVPAGPPKRLPRAPGVRVCRPRPVPTPARGGSRWRRCAP